jgi:hypothetical protein
MKGKLILENQTEWDVEIVTEFIEEEKTGVENVVWGRLVPKLDENGNLILKRL